MSQKIREAKRKYNKAVRKLKRNKQQAIANKVAESNVRVYSHVSYKPTQVNAPSEINGKSQNQQLDMWYNHFQKVLEGQSAPSSAHTKCDVTATLLPEAFSVDEISSCIINTLPKALDKSYEHNHNYLYSPKIAHRNLAIGLNNWCQKACLKKDDVNYNFLNSIITPIPKTGKKDYSKTNCWRPIACSTTVCFLFEKLLIQRMKPFLVTKENQFAYKSKHGCVQSISIINEASKSVDDFHVALLDASAAFDKISWNRIMEQMAKRKLPEYLQLILVALMANTSFKLKWDGVTSKESFFASKGVKQGGCISALIFSCCYDDLILECQKSCAGIFVHETFLNIIVYADDILLVSASPFGLKDLLDITKKFCQKHADIELNHEKSTILRMGKYGRKKNGVSIDNIPVKKSEKYLGVWLNNDKLEEARAVRFLYAKTNQVLRQNGNINLCSHKTKNMVLNAYGSVYSLEAFTKVTSKMVSAHRYLTKSIFNYEWRRLADLKHDNGWTDIRSRALYAGMGLLSLKETHRWRRNNFILKSRSSDNQLVRNIIGSMSFAS